MQLQKEIRSIIGKYGRRPRMKDLKPYLTLFNNLQMKEWASSQTGRLTAKETRTSQEDRQLRRSDRESNHGRRQAEKEHVNLKLSVC